MRRFLLVAIILFLASTVLAYKNDNFLRNVAQIMYSDCGPANFDGNVISSSDGYFQILKDIDSKIGTGSMYVGSYNIDEIQPIIWCQSASGKHELKIFNDNYYWDNVEVTAPSANCPTCPKIDCPVCPNLDVNSLPALGVNVNCPGGGCQQNTFQGNYGDITVNKSDLNLFVTLEIALIGVSIFIGLIAEAKFELWRKLRKSKK